MTEVVHVENIAIKKDQNGTVLHFSLCNRGNKTYYLENRFLPDPKSDVLFGITLIQDDKKAVYKGAYRKGAPSEFPKDYRSIEPGACLEVDVDLDRFFVWNKQKRASMSYRGFNDNPLTKDLDEIAFEYRYEP